MMILTSRSNPTTAIWPPDNSSSSSEGTALMILVTVNPASEKTALSTAYWNGKRICIDQAMAKKRSDKIN